MKRLIEEQLLEWKNSPRRKPLVVLGARQVGKTWSLKHFGETEYENIAYLNFERDGSLSGLFNANLHPQRIIDAIADELHITIKKGKTLIFFDEIQICEKALTSLKYFCEEANEYHIVAAGSLLGLVLNRKNKKTYSFPVGKVNMLNMYPLTFEEFLLVTGHKTMRDLIIDSYHSMSEFPLHEQAMDLFRLYLIVGGYPEAVQTFLDTGNLDAVRDSQMEVNNSLMADMIKYADSAYIQKINKIYSTIVKQLAKETTKFQYAVIEKGARSKDYADPLDWLISVSAVLYCDRVDSGEYPLSDHINPEFFKIYYSDVGLLTARMKIRPKSFVNGREEISDDTRGMLAESYLAEQLAAMGAELHYWGTSSQTETDFVIQFDDKVIPIEVKSAIRNRTQNLKLFVKSYSPAYSVRCTGKNFGYGNNIKSIPLYAAFCLKFEMPPKNHDETSCTAKEL